MEDGELFCELCGSSDNVETVSIRVDRDMDDVCYDKADVCLRCYTMYENNIAMFLDIFRKRIEEEKEEFDEMDI